MWHQALWWISEKTMRRLFIRIIGLALIGGLVLLIRRKSSPGGIIRGGVPPESETTCPSGHPIKGNIRPPDEYIFYVPGEPTYDRIHPEICFATVEDARKAGFEPVMPTT